MSIDAHTHAVPEVFPARPGWPRVTSDGSGAVVLHTQGQHVPLPAEFWDVDARLAALDISGLRAEVVSPLPQLIDYGAPAELYAEVCRYVNEWMAGFCAAGSGRLAGLGILPLQDLDVSLAALAEVRERGLVGVQVGASVNGTLIGDPRFAELFLEAARLDLAVLVHALPVGGYFHTLPQSIVPPVGMPAEVGLAAAELILGSDPARHGARVAFSHGGGGFVSAITRAQFFWANGEGLDFTADTVGKGYAPPPDSPLFRARRYFFDTVVFDAGALGRLIDVFGSETMIAGSDYPATRRFRPVSLDGSPAPTIAAETLEANARRWVGRWPD